jgi:hypothetical protein
MPIHAPPERKAPKAWAGPAERPTAREATLSLPPDEPPGALPALLNDRPQVRQMKAMSERLSEGRAKIPAPAPAPTQRAANSTGLPDRLKAGLEHLSGLAMDDVRVHFNSARPAQLQALAYTQGTEIHVGPGQERHLAHEAWHVVQQKQGRVRPTIQAKGLIINDDPALEREADRRGRQAEGAGEAVGELKSAAAPGAAGPIQRTILVGAKSYPPADSGKESKVSEKPPNGAAAALSTAPAPKALAGPKVAQLVRYVRAPGGVSEVADSYQLKQGEAFVDTEAPSLPQNLKKKVTKIEFELNPPGKGQVELFKGTSLGSINAIGGIAEAGLDPKFGGKVGGSGIWEREAADRHSNLGWTTFGTSLQAALVYARGFEEHRRKSPEEAKMLEATGMLNAKWIGVVLRVLVSEQELKGEQWRPDPGSGAGDGAHQTQRVVNRDEIEVAAIVAFVSAPAAIALRPAGLSLEEIEAILRTDFYEPLDWSPTADSGGSASSAQHSGSESKKGAGSKLAQV